MGKQVPLLKGIENTGLGQQSGSSVASTGDPPGPPRACPPWPPVPSRSHPGPGCKLLSPPPPPPLCPRVNLGLWLRVCACGRCPCRPGSPATLRKPSVNSHKRGYSGLPEVVFRSQAVAGLALKFTQTWENGSPCLRRRPLHRLSLKDWRAPAGWACGHFPGVRRRAGGGSGRQ